MKILLISNLYGWYARGGAERLVRIEATALRARGHEVAVASAVPESDLPPFGVCSPNMSKVLCGFGISQQTEDSGVEHFTFYPPNSCFYSNLEGKSWLGRLVWHWLDIFNWRSAAQLKRIIAVNKPDVVHTHNLMGIGFAVPNLLWRLRIRHVHTVHDVQLVHPSGLLSVDWRPHWPHEWLYIWLMRFMMGSPQVVLFPSEHAKQLHNRFGFFPKSTQVVLRNSVAIGKKRAQQFGTTRFLFVGQLETHKGIEDLLSAWQSLSDRQSATLQIVGDGSLRSKIRDTVEILSGVEMVGPVYGDGLEDYFSSASFLIVPSKVIENAPLVILEAFARGLPVIAAKSGGIPELVEDGRTGRLFKPGDAASLAEALQRSVTDDKWSEMSDNCFKRAQKMTIVGHVDALEKIYRV
ncbi:MAG: glycosyltransferase [Patescibacteria group bacterium]